MLLPKSKHACNSNPSKNNNRNKRLEVPSRSHEAEPNESVLQSATNPALAAAAGFLLAAAPIGLSRVDWTHLLRLEKESRIEELEQRVRVTLRTSLDKNSLERVAPTFYELKPSGIDDVKAVVKNRDIHQEQPIPQLLD